MQEHEVPWLEPSQVPAFADFWSVVAPHRDPFLAAVADAGRPSDAATASALGLALQTVPAVPEGHWQPLESELARSALAVAAEPRRLAAWCRVVMAAQRLSGERLGEHRVGEPLRLAAALGASQRFWERCLTSVSGSVHPGGSGPAVPDPALNLPAEAYQLLFKSNPQPAWVVDLRTLGFLDVNQAAEGLYGYSREEMRTRTIADDLPPNDRAKLLAKRESLPLGPSQGQWQIRRKDGSARWIEVITQEMRGDPNLRLVIGKDITDQHRTLDALRKSEMRFARLSEAGVVGVLVGDASGRILEANDAFLQMVGFTRSELEAGRVRWDDLTPPEWMEVSRRTIAELRQRASVRPVEKEYLRKDGTRVPVLITAATLEGEEHLTLVVDLSDRRVAEAARKRSESIFRTLVESSPDALSLVAADTKLLYASPAAARIMGREPEALVGMRMLDEGTLKDREAYRIEWEKCLAQPGVPLRFRFFNRRFDGSTRYLESIRINQLDDPNIRAVVTILRDLTDQHQLEEQLRQAQKMEAIGALAGGVAHDFNNLLTVILGYSEGLLAGLGKADPLRAYVDEIHHAGIRAAALTRQLLAVSRRQVLNPRVLDLHQIILDMHNLVRRLIGAQVELATHVEPELDNVKADPTQIEQVLMNLVVNARDAMPNGGLLTLQAGNVALDAGAAQGFPGAQPGRYVLLSVKDTGTGIDPETQQRIFEPFFTTKKELGTGLGLATVFGIVRQSGGFLSVESAVGKGSTFRILLPSTTEAEPPRRTPAGEATGLGGSETILVAEDEQAVRTLILEILRRNGYQALGASNAGEALLTCERHAGPIHLLLTDLVMPQMNGRELAGRLASVRPSMRVLYMSGYHENPDLQRQVDAGVAMLLAKPITATLLLSKVRELLGAPPDDSLGTTPQP
jgi:two-component system cell cycle sensor histidine kinase/response regulator CckA